MDRNNCTNVPDQDEVDETTPLVDGAESVEPRVKLLECLLDKTGYGVFHIILLIGNLRYII